MKLKLVNKKKFIISLFSIIFIILLIILLIKNIIIEKNNSNENSNLEKILAEIENNKINNNNINTQINNSENNNNKITDWKLILVNIDNEIPQDYKFELENIDQYRQFDSRAIKELKEMIEEERKAGASSIWVQSAYRSIEDQTNVFNKQVESYKNQGKTQEEAEELTLKIINKPGTSEHNLGLAVDFNYASNDFENTTAFEWLNKNAENYGFILRYPKDKEKITKVNYEPWHWRYVGVENAKEINKLNYCLEEYIDYLNNK